MWSRERWTFEAKGRCSEYGGGELDYRAFNSQIIARQTSSRGPRRVCTKSHKLLSLVLIVDLSMKTPRAVSLAARRMLNNPEECQQGPRPGVMEVSIADAAGKAEEVAYKEREGVLWCGPFSSSDKDLQTPEVAQMRLAEEGNGKSHRNGTSSHFRNRNDMTRFTEVNARQ